MKKRTAILSILMAGMLTLSAGAAEITKVIVSDFDNSIITVSGEADEAMVSITVLPKDSVLTEGEYLAKDNISIQKADVTEGKFTASFKFGGSSGWYDFYVSGNGEAYTFEYISAGDVLKFIEDLGNKVYSGTELAEKLRYFAPAMGIDLDFATGEEAMESVITAVEAGSELIKADGVTALSAIVKQTQAELELLGAIADAETATVVNNLLNKYAETAKVDISKYTLLTDYGRTAVCEGLAGKAYSDIAEFRTDFAEAVASAPESDPDEDDEKDSGSSRPSRGGGGGGGAVSIPVTPVMPEPEVEDGTVIFDRFNDIDNTSWAWEAILYLSDKNIMAGNGDGSFLPGDSIKREQFAKIMAVAFDCYDAGAKDSFADVADSDWSAPYVASVRNLGYMNGIDDNNFGYGMDISRQDICVTLYRAVQLMGYSFNNQKTDFTDFAQVSDYAKEAVAYFAGEGVISGAGNGAFNPLSSATRAEAAQIVYSVMTKLLNK